MAPRDVARMRAGSYHQRVLPLSLILLTLQDASAPRWRPEEVAGGASRLVAGLAIACLVYRLARRMPWPSPFRLCFAAVHLVAAPLAALAWFASSSALAALFLAWRSAVEQSDRLLEYMFLGIIGYAIVVGVSHAMEG